MRMQHHRSRSGSVHFLLYHVLPPAKFIKSVFPGTISTSSCPVSKEEPRKIIKEDMLASSKENVKEYAFVLKTEMKGVNEKKPPSDLAQQVVVQMDVDNLELKKKMQYCC